MGPNLYEDYYAPQIGNIFRKHSINFHIYAHDTQAYIEFHPYEEKTALHKLETCLHEIRLWMAANWLKLNDSKTELITFGSKSNLPHLNVQSVTVGDSSISNCSSVKSIGAHLDASLNMDKQISAVCKSSWYALYQISKIRKYLTIDQTKSVVYAHVISRLDQNNSLLLGIPQISIRRLQLVQNAAARLIIGIK